MPRNAIVAVVGTGQETEPAVSNARELGRLIAEHGWVLITGGRNAGVMKAANEGAKRFDVDDAGRNATVSERARPNHTPNGLSIGILPNRETEISPDVDVAIVTDIGEARNNIIVLSADVVIACGVDDPGTASEVSLALKAGRPVVLVDASDAARAFFTQFSEQITCVDSPREAIKFTEKSLTSSGTNVRNTLPSVARPG